MKKTFFVFFLFITAITLSSCRKSGVNLFVGDYSFKTSGEIFITAQAVIDSSNILIPAVMNVGLSNDIGQLTINVSDKDNDEVIVVINEWNGDVITTYGICEGDRIELDEFKRSTLPVSINGLLSNGTYITVSATGRMYDDMIVFDMTYKGTATIGSVTYKIKDKDIKMVAYRN